MFDWAVLFKFKTNPSIKFIEKPFFGEDMLPLQLMTYKKMITEDGVIVKYHR